MVTTKAPGASFPVYSPFTDSAKTKNLGPAYLKCITSKSSSWGLLVKANAQAPRKSDGDEDHFSVVKKKKPLFRLQFKIRSSEIGADGKTSVAALTNLLQETALNHVKDAGLLRDGFGSTPEMYKKNLIWVVIRLQIVVDRYPTWGDVVGVETWVSASGKNGVRRDWLIRDFKTGETLARATSLWVLMNKETRKLSKIPGEVRGEIEPYFMNSDPVVDEDSRKLPKLDYNTADYVRSGLTPSWSDLDVNQHVNNVKYIGWILESAPQPILESHELASLTLRYRMECGKDSELQSLTAVTGTDIGNTVNLGSVEFQHFLRLKDGAEIVRGRTAWRPKVTNNFWNVGQITAENA